MTAIKVYAVEIYNPKVEELRSSILTLYYFFDEYFKMKKILKLFLWNMCNHFVVQISMYLKLAVASLKIYIPW